MVNLPHRLSQKIIRSVQPIHEKWAGASRDVGIHDADIPLEHTSLYGIRTYENGSTLAMHVDRASTHVISAILHIARDYGVPDEEGSWPIQVVDLLGQHRKVELLPGQMLLYESSKCTHGRPEPFVGKYYASAFIHFKPRTNWPYSNEHRVGAVPGHFNWDYESWKRVILPDLAFVDGISPESAKPTGWAPPSDDSVTESPLSASILDSVKAYLGVGSQDL